jgi:hypothetical protein
VPAGMGEAYYPNLRVVRHLESRTDSVSLQVVHVSVLCHRVVELDYQGLADTIMTLVPAQ